MIVGFAVAAVDSVEPTSTEALCGMATSTPVHVRFVRPLPQIPYHDSARKAIHKPVQYKMTSEQKDWLEKNVFGTLILRYSS